MWKEFRYSRFHILIKFVEAFFEKVFIYKKFQLHYENKIHFMNWKKFFAKRKSNMNLKKISMFFEKDLLKHFSKHFSRRSKIRFHVTETNFEYVYDIICKRLRADLKKAFYYASNQFEKCFILFCFVLLYVGNKVFDICYKNIFCLYVKSLNCLICIKLLI